MKNDKEYLSKGLDALFKVNVPNKNPIPNVVSIHIENIKSGPFQPRSIFDNKELEELANSIREQGILQPIIVKSGPNSQYAIIAGERRWRAAKLAGLKEVPVLIRDDVDDKSAQIFSLIENIQRTNLNPIEEAEGYKKLIDSYGITQEDVAKYVGKSRSTITNLLRLLSLHEEVQDLISSNKLDLGHAKAIATLDINEQVNLANRICNENLSVRETEKAVNLIFSKDLTNRKLFEPEFELNQERVTNNQKSISSRLDMKVDVCFNRKGKGKVIIHLDSPSQLEWLEAIIYKATK